MKRIHIVPYKMGSKSGRLLKEALVAQGITCFRRLGDTTPPKKQTLVIYYGGSEVLPEGGVQLNRNRSIASNKLSSFRTFTEQGISCVPWTTDKAVAETWDLTVVRKLLSSHSGEGIELVERGQALPDAQLYTQYTKKQMECRLHVFGDRVIDAQVKRKRKDLPEDQEADPKIRNHHTGWVYCREDYTPEDRCKELAIAAIRAVGLDFGAVDIIYNRHHDIYYVLEVNTAPGLEGTTLSNYVQEFSNAFKR